MQRMYKVFVTTPESHTDILINAMSEAGAGVVGNYTNCAYITKGTGTFLPNEAANPTVGSIGVLNKEPEDKIEMICKIPDLEKVIAAINAVHPYESPTIDVIEIQFFTKD